MLQANSLQFLKQLKKNNSKEWFDINRKNYETVKLDFIQLIDQIIQKHAAKDA